MPLTSEKAAAIANARWRGMPHDQRLAATRRGRLSAAINLIKMSANDLDAEQVRVVATALASLREGPA